MKPFRKRNILAISGAGIVPKTSPALVAYAWAKVDSPVFTPQLRKRDLKRNINWTKVYRVYPDILRDITRLRREFGEIDVLLVDYSLRKGIHYTIALSHYILGCAQASFIRFVPARKWFAAMIGPDAILYDDDPKFDDLIVEYTRVRFPFLARKITCPQPARALALLYYGVAKYG